MASNDQESLYQVHTAVSEYIVCAYPNRESPGYRYFQIYVRRIADGVWEIHRDQNASRNECLNADGVWSYPPDYGPNRDLWLASHRFGEKEALAIAERYAPQVEVNMRTIDEMLEREQRR